MLDKVTDFLLFIGKLTVVMGIGEFFVVFFLFFLTYFFLLFLIFVPFSFIFFLFNASILIKSVFGW